MKNIRFPWRFWWAALIVAWAVDFLFWGKIPGISIPIWVIVALIAGFFLAISEGVKVAIPSLFLTAVAIALALLTSLRAEPLTRSVNILMSLCVLLLLAATLRSGDWIYYGVKDYVVTGFYLIVAILSRPIELFSILSHQNKKDSSGSPWRSFYRQVLPILRGLLLAIPVMLVLGALLASADPVFNDRMTNLLRFLDLQRITEYIFRFFFIILPLAYLFSGVFLHAVYPKKQLDRGEQGQSWLKPFLGSTECTVVLVGVNLLFAIFVAIQFRYLFGGEANITETGYTYSEYARRGFGELVAVAVLSLLLYMSLGTITKLEKRSRRISFSTLSIILIGLVLVMLASAFKRLNLYENAYGFTRLRTYTHIFILWLALLLIAMVLLEVINRRRYFAVSIIIGIIGFSLTLGAINVDGYIVRQNVQRTVPGEKLDGAYLRTLSSDAVPELFNQFQLKNLSPQIHDQLGLELVCRIAAFIPEKGEKPLQWQSFHLGENIARNILFKRFSGWEGQYTLQRDLTGWSVHSTVTQNELYCSSSLGAWD